MRLNSPSSTPQLAWFFSNEREHLRRFEEGGIRFIPQQNSRGFLALIHVYEIIANCNEIIKNFSNFYYNHLPKLSRAFISIILQPVHILGTKFLSLIYQLFLPIYLLQGKEKYSGTNITILFLSDKKTISYYSNLIFYKNPSIEKIGVICVWKIGKIFQNIPPNIDAVFLKSDRFYSKFLHKHDFILIPEWISMKIDISESVDTIYRKFKKSAKKEIKKLENNDYIYEISTDLDKLKKFYYKMYLPYIYRRYGELTRCMSFNTVRGIFEKGTLVLVKDDESYILGFLLIITKNTVKIACYGIPEGKTDYLRKGLGAARYCFCILWAKQKNFKILDLGFCRSFLNDGVLQYKRKWGADIRKCERDFVAGNFTGVIGLRIINFKKGIQDFLVKNPFLYTDESHLKEMSLPKK